MICNEVDILQKQMQRIYAYRKYGILVLCFDVKFGIWIYCCYEINSGCGLRFGSILVYSSSGISGKREKIPTVNIIRCNLFLA